MATDTDIRGLGLYFEFSNSEGEVAQCFATPELVSPTSQNVVPPSIFTRTADTATGPLIWRSKRDMKYKSEAALDAKGALARQTDLVPALVEAERALASCVGVLDGMSQNDPSRPLGWKAVGQPFVVEIGAEEVPHIEGGRINDTLGRRIAACRTALGYTDLPKGAK